MVAIPAAAASPSSLSPKSRAGQLLYTARHGVSFKAAAQIAASVGRNEHLMIQGLLIKDFACIVTGDANILVGERDVQLDYGDKRTRSPTDPPPITTNTPLMPLRYRPYLMTPRPV